MNAKKQAGTVRGTSASERETRSAAPETRGDRGLNDGGERDTTDGLTSDDAAYQRLLESEFDQTALPQPPELPGWHLCWLTTTSAYDTMQKRQRLGYQPVRRSEMSGFDPSNGKDLQGHEGFVTCNELVLCKLPEPRYQQMMRYFHHTQPLQNERTVLEINKQLSAQKDASGKALITPEGGDENVITDMEESIRRNQNATPVFS